MSSGSIPKVLLSSSSWFIHPDTIIRTASLSPSGSSLFPFPAVVGDDDEEDGGDGGKERDGERGRAYLSKANSLRPAVRRDILYPARPAPPAPKIDPTATTVPIPTAVAVVPPRTAPAQDTRWEISQNASISLRLRSSDLCNVLLPAAIKAGAARPPVRKRAAPAPKDAAPLTRTFVCARFDHL